MTSALAVRLRRLEALQRPKGEPLTMFNRALLAIVKAASAADAVANAAIDAIPRRRLRGFARGILDRIVDARGLAEIDEIEDGGADE